ncbi:MAG: carboxypeptidase regulatory-like domain-containing protein [Candidatus Pacebacteria bacterium]|nr:carboxypeptidase regulatory-like domain-containing protein [Candidatus Paceibacterota bacterium]
MTPHKHNKNILIVFVGVISLLFVLVNKPYIINASTTLGTIDAVHKNAKGVDNKDIKINFGLFKGSINVKVTDGGLSGFAWGEGIGWVNLAPSDGGVVNNGEGILSGYATSEFGGWINFKGVNITSDGEFMGYATSEKFGRISFNCKNDNSCNQEDYSVSTDWRPISIRADGSSAPDTVASTTPPSNKPTSSTNTDTTSTIKQKPLPVLGDGEYYYGGDVIKINNGTVTNPDGGITYIMPTDEKSIPNNKKTLDVEVEKPSGIITSVAKKTAQITNNIIQEKQNDSGIEETVVSFAPGLDISTKTVTTAGVVGGSTTIVSSMISSALSISDFFLNFIRLWSLFLSAVGLKKKRQSWGTVYDSVTKQPLDPVYVVLLDKNNKEVSTAITDMDGRFGFLVPSGTYRISVKKNNYIFPSLKLKGRDTDGVYDNLYFGDDMFIEQGKIITKNIPMDPERFDWNEFTKKDKNLLKFNSPYAWILSVVSNFLFYAGFLLAIFLLVVNGFNLYNIVVISFYAVLMVFKKVNLKTKTHGVIKEKDTMFPLSFAVVRVFAKGGTKEIFHRVADKYGNYYCLIPKGEYYIKIDKKNNDESYTNVYTSENLVIKNGILNKDFVV